MRGRDCATRLLGSHERRTAAGRASGPVDTPHRGDGRPDPTASTFRSRTSGVRLRSVMPFDAQDAGDVRPNPDASIIAADLDHHAECLDAVAGSKFVDDRIRLRSQATSSADLAHRLLLRRTSRSHNDPRWRADVFPPFDCEAASRTQLFWRAVGSTVTLALDNSQSHLIG
jgi:hypothetical protein